MRLRIAISLTGALILFLISWRLGEEYAESYNIDKVFHILMSLCIALFLSVFIGRPVSLVLAVLAAGFLWEVFQFYHDFSAMGIYFNQKAFLSDSAGDLFADLAGAIFFVWWIYPHTN